MTRTLRAIIIAALITLPAIAQKSSGIAFDVADVHQSPSRLHPGIDGQYRPDRVAIRDATLSDLIAIAYHVDPADILGGPASLDFDRVDINAKPPAGTKITDDQSDQAVAAMIRSLLVERFALVAHEEKRPLPAFVLSAGKGNQMKPAADTTGPNGCEYQQQAAGGQSSVTSLVNFSCRNTTMSDFASFLHEAGGPYFKRPVVDQTGLKGGWDFDLHWSYMKSNGGDGISLPDALSKQLGLKIESKAIPTSVVVVQSVNEKPTPNVANIAALLPPTPPRQFDVAVIRVSNPMEKNFNIDTNGHRVAVQFATLETLIYKSFDMPPNMIQNKPTWLNDVHYDIVGTVASNGEPAIPGHEADLDNDDVKEMIRSLLADRFKLVTHMGTQSAAVFALTADSPKMKRASDSEHSSCVEGPGPDGKDLRMESPLRNRLITCQNMTMAQFAIELHNLASGFVPAPVVDSTGLTGGYDFTVSFSKANLLRTSIAGPSTAVPSGGGTEAPDPASTGLPPISLFDALQKQLGLKLVKKDRVDQPVLVIDHVEEKPSDN
jgi:uncharacterized protein (TIGR03435 family)